MIGHPYLIVKALPESAMNYKDLETSEPGGRSFREPEAGIPYLPPWKMFFVILLNNSAKSFLVLQSGIMFGLVPLLAVATNGYILGVAYLFVRLRRGRVCESGKDGAAPRGA
jgi:uncharacterized membrane protein SpoIIM required for sporulation